MVDPLTLDRAGTSDHYGHMRAGVAELKSGLSRFLDRVRGGQEILVTDRGRPIAKLVPVAGGAREGSRRDRQVREGLLLPGRGKLRRSLLEAPKGESRQGRGVLEALIEERRGGR